MELTKERVLDTLRQHVTPGHPGLKIQDLTSVLDLDSKGRHRLRRLLQELLEEGVVERTPGARYRFPGNEEEEIVPAPSIAAPSGSGEARTGALEARTGAELAIGAHVNRVPVVGRIRVHPAGYGFVEREDGEADVFVPARFRGTALDGDRVKITTWMGYKGTEGRVQEVLERGRAKLTGTVRIARRHVYLEPDDPRIASAYGHVPLEDGPGGARDGQSVVAEITRYPTVPTPANKEGGGLWARVTHVLGDPDDPRTEVAKVIACADIPDVFPDDTLSAAQRTPRELTAADFADRIDLRDRPFLTIDPTTARDFDDAVVLEERGDGHRLWVAVADVSHYVQAGGALDREARVRGCSVYLPDRAIPMLPPELSSGICSLNPEVDRCAMVVRIDLDRDGVPREKALAAAVIRSHARLDYPGVAAALLGDFRGPRARYREWADSLARMHSLAQKMRERRRRRGSLDFDLPEAAVILDEDDPRRVRDVRRSRANQEVKIAYQMIEEFMLAANEAVAEYFRERGLNCVWRVHDTPDSERLTEFARLAESFGISVSPEEGQSPLALQRVLAQVAGKPFERSMNFLLLRSLKQATYDVVNIGHFGLASKDYLHFTSPIRRYPDLIVHRLLKVHLRRDGSPSGGASHPPAPRREDLAAMAGESSSHERRAVEAEREVVDMYRAFLMRDRIGEELDGIISGVTSFGLFVECSEPFVEGLVKIDQIGDDRYELNEESMRLVGRRSGRSFTLGDAVRVRVENVSVPRRRIDLSLLEGGTVGEKKRAEQRRPRARRRKGKG